MNSNIKMEIINAEGKLIQKEIEPALYSNYLAMGWKEVKKEKPSAKKVFEKKEDSEDKE